MRTHRRGRETRQGRIRLKNLLKQATEKLSAAGFDDSMLQPLHAKVDDDGFWQQQGDGLAIYLSDDSCEMLRLNRRVDDVVVVTGSFYIQPLIRESNDSGRYFVLALSWDAAQLMRGDGGGLEIVETDLLPAKFDELVLPRDPEVSLQNTTHQSVGDGGGTSVSMFHGQGEGEDKIEADRDQYLTRVGDEVTNAVYNTGLPLVVVATGEVTGQFRASTDVVVAAKVDGSPSELSDDELRERARQAIAPHLKVNHHQFAEKLGNALADSRGSQDLDEVLSAATEGRVEALMICPNENQADMHHRTRLNKAVVQTLRNGGEVFQAEHGAMPLAATLVAAMFRYRSDAGSNPGRLAR
ncbi:MAG: hypothetical protein AAF802_27455 [Planctomycetota bacterium]